MIRIIIFIGKGGVGKLSVVVVYVLFFVKSGKKILLVSVDIVYNLGDIFKI